LENLKKREYGNFDDLEMLESISFDFDSFKNKNYLTHNFHPYPAKFVPQIPKILISTLSKPNDVVLDPFCGCGTTLVESKLLGRNSIGIDINPIATLISEVKTNPLNDLQLQRIKKITARIGRHIKAHYGIKLLFQNENFKNVRIIIPSFPNRDHWFMPHVIQELAIIKAHINEVNDFELRKFMLVALSSIIVKVSNQESDTRYARKDKKIAKGEVFVFFNNKINGMIERMKEFGKKATSSYVKVFNADSRNIEFIHDCSIDLVVTSPPYLNAYDYYLYHRLRMHWLNMDHKMTQELEIGSRHKHSDKGLGIEDYLNSLKKCFREIRRVLKDRRYCCIVIGDAIKDGEYIKMDEKIQLLMEELKFELRKKVSYPLRKYTLSFTRGYKNGEKKGHIMIFRKK